MRREPQQSENKRKRILLSGVFGPYGVDDDYGRKENIMELFHNQVTKAQGEASFRFFHRSFGLYFLAANVDADVTVLDFPSAKRFERELKKGYDVVGISFITPNFLKAQEMARLTRVHAPEATIVLGGHGAAIEGVEDLIACDHVVRGEGIRWLRAFLGQDPDAPFVHPSLPSTEKQSIFGVPVPGPTASLLVPGVGCVNGCKFCCTSHFFGKRYTSYLSTGRELFETACRIADERGTDTFFVMDENFLKDRQRGLELLEEMDRHGRYFKFHLFSSAESITAFGIDNLVRLGAQFVWLGVESQTEEHAYVKNAGIDATALVRSLRDCGISVLASGILCAEHHTPENIQDEIDFLVGLNADMIQFMLLTPLPVTGLYRDHQRRGILRDDIPFEEWHGQKMLIYRHPAFAEGEPERWMDHAFRQEFETNSSSIYRTIETSLRGVEYLRSLGRLDDCLSARLEQIEDRAREYGCMMPVIGRHAVNRVEAARAADLDARFEEVFGAPSLKQRLVRAAVRACAAWWKLRVAVRGDGVQPRTLVTRYHGETARTEIARHRVEESREHLVPQSINTAACSRT
jgi:hypothetical protein